MKNEPLIPSFVDEVISSVHVEGIKKPEPYFEFGFKPEVDLLINLALLELAHELEIRYEEEKKRYYYYKAYKKLLDKIFRYKLEDELTPEEIVRKINQAEEFGQLGINVYQMNVDMLQEIFDLIATYIKKVNRDYELISLQKPLLGKQTLKLIQERIESFQTSGGGNYTNVFARTLYESIPRKKEAKAKKTWKAGYEHFSSVMQYKQDREEQLISYLAGLYFYYHNKNQRPLWREEEGLIFNTVREAILDSNEDEEEKEKLLALIDEIKLRLSIV